MEGREFVLNADDESQDERLFSPRWTQMASILYALSILTTTGYASATPTTLLGQWVAIGYGLLGIPLMVLAAVDVGRFLSEVVLATYAKVDTDAKIPAEVIEISVFVRKLVDGLP
uniref:Ion_trans_2 domain-containing protein n=1 Tax=Ascaris lumbricoides TaxID=6252 RepID=A0A0M3HHV5_ASCLU